MNKKGTKIFMPLLVAVTFIVMVSLAVSISRSDRERNAEILGKQAESIFTMYDEVEHARVYLEKVTDFAAKEAEIKLAERGGYAEFCAEKFNIPGKQGINLLNDCSNFNPKKEFEKELQTQIYQYLQNYKSPFEEREQAEQSTIFQKLGIIPELIAEERQETYESAIKNIKIEKLEWKDERIKISFAPISLKPKLFNQIKIDPTNRGEYSFKIETTTEEPNLEIYNNLYRTLSSCSSNFDECAKTMQTTFTEAEVVVIAGLLKFSITIEQGTIQFVFDPTKPLPKAETTFR